MCIFLATDQTCMRCIRSHQFSLLCDAYRWPTSCMVCFESYTQSFLCFARRWPTCWRAGARRPSFLLSNWRRWASNWCVKCCCCCSAGVLALCAVVYVLCAGSVLCLLATEVKKGLFQLAILFFRSFTDAMGCSDTT